jgi:N-acetylneuraminic acid mutarotase
VYPNFTQIFVAGGSTSENEATKACERYIVKDDQWKRLPELKEAKINIGLCFFNNGSTLYCFGGATKSMGILNQTKSIERLSKG